MDNNDLERLEIRLAYLEDYLKQLNEVVLGHTGEMAKMKAEQEKLKNQLEELADNLPGPESAKPPH